MALEEERFDGGSHGIAWRRLGEGPPLLLINGYAATKDDWDPGFLAVLAADSTVICPDNRGVGESARGEGEITIDSMAADLARLVDDLGIESFDLAGWSMGGYISQTLAWEMPHRIRSLTLLGTDPGGPRSKVGEKSNWDRLTDKSGSPEEQAERLISLLFPRPFADQVQAAAGEIVAGARAALDPAVLAEQEQAMIGWRKKHKLPLYGLVHTDSLRFPVLAACGSLDEVIPPENSEVIATLVKDAWLARFPGGGHAFMAQEPERLGKLISLFLAR